MAWSQSDSNGNTKVFEAANGIVISSPIKGQELRYDDVAQQFLNRGVIGAKVHRSTVQAAAHATATAISFNVEDYDTDGFFSLGSPTRLTAPITGVYMLTAGMMWTGSGVGSYRISWLRKNGGATLVSDSRAPHSNGFMMRQQLPMQVDLVAGDYVELMVQQDSGASLNTAIDGEFAMYFSMSLVGQKS